MSDFDLEDRRLIERMVLTQSEITHGLTRDVSVLDERHKALDIKHSELVKVVATKADKSKTVEFIKTHMGKGVGVAIVAAVAYYFNLIELIKWLLP